MNLLIILIILVIMLGTKFINYYHNFFYIYKELNNNEKTTFFKNNFLIKMINKNIKLKTFITINILTPLIKINYLILSLLIYLLYGLCENELDNILIKNNYNDSIFIDTPTSKTIDKFEDIDRNEYLQNNGFTNIKNQLLISPNSIFSCSQNDNLPIGNLEKNSIEMNENLTEYLMENIQKKVGSEPILEKQVVSEPILEEPIETISMEEIDFGDYMSNFLSDTLNKTENDTEKQTLTQIPIKIKIGKKKINK